MEPGDFDFSNRDLNDTEISIVESSQEENDND